MVGVVPGRGSRGGARVNHILCEKKDTSYWLFAVKHSAC